MQTQHYEPDSPDPLAPARGCLNGILLSSAFYLLVGLVWLIVALAVR